MTDDTLPPAKSRESLRHAALAYHELPTPGKLSVVPSKKLTNQHDLALAYSPGVAIACEEIAADPLAAQPVMEGKAVLFKKFTNLDVFDIEINERDPAKLIEIIAALEPTFGGINLEDIKAPECFEIERKLRARMKIPVFHDDQHGTAIIVAAATLNGLAVVGKKLDE